MKTNWIACEDEMPGHHKVVVVQGGVGYYNVDTDTWHTAMGADHGRAIEWPVTHWMPLPSLYDLPDDVTKTMYPHDMKQKAVELPRPVESLEAEAIILGFEYLIRALSIYYREKDGGDAAMNRLASELKGVAHDLGI